MKEIARIARMLVRLLLFFFLPPVALSVSLNYPYDSDPAMGGGHPAPNPDAQLFYDRVYAPQETGGEQSSYIETEQRLAEALQIRPALRELIQTYRLEDSKVLEVGSGTGSLQDMVEDYTGLDISPNVARLYHKPFVLGSATALPFPDSSFDVAWTVWVLEHVPEPERMLAELRRVVKPQGLLYVCPAWNCAPWATTGYESRPYSDFGFGGKVAKAAIPARKLSAMIARIPIRLIRSVHYRLAGNRTRLRFRSLKPNYDSYWGPDSDAAVSLDSFEACSWFESRGVIA